MKMIYPQRDKNRQRKKRIVQTTIVGASLVIILLVNFFSPHFFSPLAHSIGVPMLESRTIVANSFSGLWEVLHSKLALIDENQNLKEKLALMNALQAERDALQGENTQLKELLGRSGSTTPGILAHVLAKPNYSIYDTVIIDVGTADNVHEGDIVVVDESVIIGEITSANAHSSNVVLFSAPDQKNEVFVGAKSLETTALGDGGGVFEIKLPRNAGISVGDTVTLAQFPEKVFGTVTYIDETPTDSFDKMLFRSPIDINEISYVTVEPHAKDMLLPAHIAPHASSTNHR